MKPLKTAKNHIVMNDAPRTLCGRVADLGVHVYYFLYSEYLEQGINAWNPRDCCKVCLKALEAGLRNNIKNI